MMAGSENIVTAARGWINTPYRHQASLRGVGCDCLGLVRGVWREIYGTEPEAAPPYAADWAEAGAGETFAEAGFRHMLSVPNDSAKIGDVLLFRWRPHLPAKHAAILSAENRMIHAHDGLAVCEVEFSKWWQRRVGFVFRFPEVK